MAPPSSPGSADRDAVLRRARLEEPEFSNPPVAEGINVPDPRHLRSFVVNLAIVAGAVLVLVVCLNLAAAYLMPLVPFEWERQALGPALFESPLNQRGRERQEALRRLADRLAAAGALAEGMTVNIHYNPSPVPNAYATIGGNIVVNRGIIELVNSEDGLAMVLAHEMAHIKHRDPIKGVMKAAGFLLLMAGIGDAGAHVETIAGVGMADYSRRQESAADAEAVSAIIRLYGHAGGAAELFRGVAGGVEGRAIEGSGRGLLPPLFASHPDTVLRFDEARRLAETGGHPFEGEPTPLPDAFRAD